MASIKCPKCKSFNIKAVGGALLTGGIGLLAGFAGKGQI